MRRDLQLIVSCLGLALAACGNGDGVEVNADGNGEDQSLATAQPGASGEPAAERAAGSAVAAPGSGEAEVLQATAVSDTGVLTAYVGKYPFEEVGGLTWKEHPLVIAGIRKTVTDAAVRTAIATPEGPSAPIATFQGKVGSWGCQPHNCGDHQWAVLVDPASGATDVCYHNAEASGGSSRWFLASGKEETRPGNCSVV